MSGASATPTTFSVHGVAISADVRAILFQRGVKAIAAGDQVMARGSFGSGTLSVGTAHGVFSFVVDSGPPRTHEHDWQGF
jgi:hypothetical protein